MNTPDPTPPPQEQQAESEPSLCGDELCGLYCNLPRGHAGDHQNRIDGQETVGWQNEQWLDGLSEWRKRALAAEVRAAELEREVERLRNGIKYLVGDCFMGKYALDRLRPLLTLAPAAVPAELTPDAEGGMKKPLAGELNSKGLTGYALGKD